MAKQDLSRENEKKSVDEVAEQLKVLLVAMKTSVLAPQVSFDEDLFVKAILDSLTLVQFIMVIEDEFKVRIQNEDITYENFKSLGIMAEFLLSRYLQSKAG